MDIFNLYDDVIDTVTGEKATIIYVSDNLVDDCYLVELADYTDASYWREASQLLKNVEPNWSCEW